MDQYSQEFPEESFDLPPEDFSQVRGKEKVFNSDDFRAPEPKKPSKPQKAIPPITSIAKPASELLKPKETVTVIPTTEVKVHKQGRKPTGKAMSNAERQKKWREANREVALARQRESMKKLRSSK